MNRTRWGCLVLALVLGAGCADTTGPPPDDDGKDPDEPRKTQVDAPAVGLPGYGDGDVNTDEPEV